MSTLLNTRNLKSEIPNVTGQIGYDNTSGSAVFGCFSFVRNYDTRVVTGEYHQGWIVDFDASRSSDRYGNYAEVNPLYNSCRYLIKY